ncbi:MAG: hypothetical protein RR840_03090 [Clostridium sp.]
MSEVITTKFIKRDYIYIGAALCLGLLLGITSKYLDTIGDNKTTITTVLCYLGDMFTDMGIWIFLASIITLKSRQWYIASISVFLFFVGMITTYYIYSMGLFGFFPKSYFLMWGSITLVSPILAYILWGFNNPHQYSYLLLSLPAAYIMSYGLNIEFINIYIFNYSNVLLATILIIGFLYKSPKKLAITLILSILLSLLIKYIDPIQFL